MEANNVTYYLPISGTHGYRGSITSADWFHHESAFAAFLGARGFAHLCPERPFTWTTDLNGHRFWRRWLGRKSTSVDWLVGGINLYAYLQPPLGSAVVPLERANLIAHSHGLQVVLFACSMGLKIRRLVSVGSPVRADLDATAVKAKANIEQWIHVYSDRSDRFQWLGTIGDGVFGITRQHPHAHINICVPGVAHTRLLNDAKTFHWWDDVGLIARLKGATEDHDASQ